ncbi:uncharacterized protein C8orf74 homolog [Danio rerio]|uniref:Uncharacterized protein C8orf74 homolog n=1 Tax=Danio rerio TaxID=7955 RepID=A0A8M1RRK3_DANRE|nr:uncharacterized protein C8orf74 homolog [Danio rerio]|eukprot:XP_002665172.1 uncharacterized protein C8orf74 homolog [Danio rerio]
MMASIHTLQEISRMKRDEGIDRLSRCFEWMGFDGDDKRQFLHQEFVYENVMFAVTRGLPWSTVGQVAIISKDLLPKINGLKSSEVISLVKAGLSQINPRLSATHHAVLLDFIVQTYVPHQRLYQAAFSGETSLKRISQDLQIETPPQPRPLSEGTDTERWKQQQILQELRLAQSRTQAEIQELRETSRTQIMSTLQDKLHSLPDEGQISRQEVEELLHSFLRSQGEIMMESLTKETRLTENLLQVKLRQSEVQRQLANTPVFPEKQTSITPTRSKKKGN